MIKPRNFFIIKVSVVGGVERYSHMGIRELKLLQPKIQPDEAWQRRVNANTVAASSILTVGRSQAQHRPPGPLVHDFVKTAGYQGSGNNDFVKTEGYQGWGKGACLIASAW